MAITSETSRNDYVGTGAVTTYSYSFRIFAETHLLVTQRDTDGLETELVLNTDYTVDGVGDVPGGSIELAVALEADFALTIRRVLPLTQPTDISNQGSFFQKTHENTFDRLTMLIQQQQDELGRSLKAAETDVALDNLPAASERASKFLAFDADGQPIASAGTLEAIPVSSFIETLLDDATAAAARVTLGVSTADGVTLQDVAGVMSIKDGGVDADALAASVAGSGLTGGAGTALAVNPGTGLEISADTVRIAATAAGDGLTGGGASPLAVNPGTGLEISGDTVRIAATAAGDGLTGGGASALAVNPDGSTIEISSDAVRVKDAGITEAKLASAVVNKLGQNIGLVAIATGNVSYTGQGKLKGITNTSGGTPVIDIVIDGVTIKSGLSVTNGQGVTWGQSTLVMSAAGVLNSLEILFNTSLVITRASGTGNVTVAYERAV